MFNLVFLTAQLEKWSASSTMPFIIDDASESVKATGNLGEMKESTIHIAEEVQNSVASNICIIKPDL